MSGISSARSLSKKEKLTSLIREDVNKLAAYIILIHHLTTKGIKLPEEVNAIITDFFAKHDLLMDINKICMGIIDPQNSFCPGGSLAVTNGNDIFDPINKLKELFQGAVFITQDSHIVGDLTFASTHKVDPFSNIDVTYPDFIESEGATPVNKTKNETVWPDHCVEGTEGSQNSPLLVVDNTEEVIKKGFGKRESYSAVRDTLGQFSTHLLEWLNTNLFEIVFISGLARDYCAGGTAEDLAKEGKTVFMLEDCTKAVSPESDAKMTERLRAVGVLSTSVSEIFSEIKVIYPEF